MHKGFFYTIGIILHTIAEAFEAFHQLILIVRDWVDLAGKVSDREIANITISFDEPKTEGK